MGSSIFLKKIADIAASLYADRLDPIERKKLG